MELPLRRIDAVRPVAVTSTAHLFATWLSATVTPPVCALFAGVVAAAHVGTPAAWYWAAMFSLMGVVAPTAFIVHEYRRGRITDLHMNVRAERVRPLAVAVTTNVLAVAALWAGEAPALLTGLAAVQLAQTVLLFVVTLRWKMSAHCVGMTGLAMLCWWLFGAAAVPVLILVPVMAWARVILDRHTVAQTAAGTLTGVALWLPVLAALPLG
jgi:hypothetical protein